MFFTTNKVVYVLPGPDQNDKKIKNSKFYDQKIIGYKNYRVKIYLTY